MSFGLQLVTGPTVEPITVGECEGYLRLDGNATDNDLLTSFITTAREYFENVTGRQCLTATWLLTLDQYPFTRPNAYQPPGRRFGIIEIPRPPLQSVTSIRYIDTFVNTQTLDPSQYQIDATTQPGRLAPAPWVYWPVTDPQSMAAVRITYVAGYTDPSLVPARWKQCIRFLVGHLYENREATAEVALNKIPYGLQAFLNSCKSGQYI